MMLRPSQSIGGRRRQSFTLIELLIAVSIMSLILFGLYSIFSETQKAMLGNVNQVDVLERGRAVIETLVGDIRQAQTPRIANPEHLPHFEIRIPSSDNQANPNAPLAPRPFEQVLADGTVRKNFIQDLVFLKQNRNRHWELWSYRVLSQGPASSFWGTLRKTKINSGSSRMNLDELFDLRNEDFKIHAEEEHMGDYVDLIDGVVHFRVQALDSSGQPMRYWIRDSREETLNEGYMPLALLNLDPRGQEDPIRLWETWTRFYREGLPSWVDLELGILDPLAMGRIESLGNNPRLIEDYLENNPEQVHIFRRLVPVVTAGVTLFDPLTQL